MSPEPTTPGAQSPSHLLYHSKAQHRRFSMEVRGTARNQRHFHLFTQFTLLFHLIATQISFRDGSNNKIIIIRYNNNKKDQFNPLRNGVEQRGLKTSHQAILHSHVCQITYRCVTSNTLRLLKRRTVFLMWGGGVHSCTYSICPPWSQRDAAPAFLCPL